eukprot:6467058-Amphidinium_carterae.1
MIGNEGWPDPRSAAHPAEAANAEKSSSPLRQEHDPRTHAHTATDIDTDTHCTHAHAHTSRSSNKCA